MRLVGVDDSRVVGELGRQCEPGVSRRQQDVAEDAVAVEIEATVGCQHTLDPRAAEALVPAAALPQLVDVAKEGRDARPVAVADAEDQRGQVAPPDGLARRQARERRGPAMAVALGAHRRFCLIAAARCRQAPAGSGSSPNTAISAGSSPPWRNVAYATNPPSPEPTIATRGVTRPT